MTAKSKSKELQTNLRALGKQALKLAHALREERQRNAKQRRQIAELTARVKELERELPPSKDQDKPPAERPDS